MIRTADWRLQNAVASFRDISERLVFRKMIFIDGDFSIKTPVSVTCNRREKESCFFREVQRQLDVSAEMTVLKVRIKEK